MPRTLLIIGASKERAKSRDFLPAIDRYTGSICQRLRALATVDGFSWNDPKCHDADDFAWAETRQRWPFDALLLDPYYGLIPLSFPIRSRNFPTDSAQFKREEKRSLLRLEAYLSQVPDCDRIIVALPHESEWQALELASIRLRIPFERLRHESEDWIAAWLDAGLLNRPIRSTAVDQIAPPTNSETPMNEADEFSPEQAILLVADSIAQLRKTDVFRLFEENEAPHWQAISNYLRRHRPDLKEEVEACHFSVRPPLLDTLPTGQSVAIAPQSVLQSLRQGIDLEAFEKGVVSHVEEFHGKKWVPTSANFQGPTTQIVSLREAVSVSNLDSIPEGSHLVTCGGNQLALLSEILLADAQWVQFLKVQSEIASEGLELRSTNGLVELELTQTQSGKKYFLAYHHSHYQIFKADFARCDSGEIADLRLAIAWCRQQLSSDPATLPAPELAIISAPSTQAEPIEVTVPKAKNLVGGLLSFFGFKRATASIFADQNPAISHRQGWDICTESPNQHYASSVVLFPPEPAQPWRYTFEPTSRIPQDLAIHWARAIIEQVLAATVTPPPPPANLWLSQVLVIGERMGYLQPVELRCVDTVRATPKMIYVQQEGAEAARIKQTEAYCPNNPKQWQEAFRLLMEQCAALGELRQALSNLGVYAERLAAGNQDAQNPLSQYVVETFGVEEVAQSPRRSEMPLDPWYIPGLYCYETQRHTPKFVFLRSFVGQVGGIVDREELLQDRAKLAFLQHSAGQRGDLLQERITQSKVICCPGLDTWANLKALQQRAENATDALRAFIEALPTYDQYSKIIMRAESPALADLSLTEADSALPTLREGQRVLIKEVVMHPRSLIGATGSIRTLTQDSEHPLATVELDEPCEGPPISMPARCLENIETADVAAVFNRLQELLLIPGLVNTVPLRKVLLRLTAYLKEPKLRVLQGLPSINHTQVCPLGEGVRIIQESWLEPYIIVLQGILGESEASDQPSIKDDRMHTLQHLLNDPCKGETGDSLLVCLREKGQLANEIASQAIPSLVAIAQILRLLLPHAGLKPEIQVGIETRCQQLIELAHSALQGLSELRTIQAGSTDDEATLPDEFEALVALGSGFTPPPIPPSLPTPPVQSEDSLTYRKLQPVIVTGQFQMLGVKWQGHVGQFIKIADEKAVVRFLFEGNPIRFYDCSLSLKDITATDELCSDVFEWKKWMEAYQNTYNLRRNSGGNTVESIEKIRQDALATAANSDGLVTVVNAEEGALVFTFDERVSIDDTVPKGLGEEGQLALFQSI